MEEVFASVYSAETGASGVGAGADPVESAADGEIRVWNLLHCDSAARPRQYDTRAILHLWHMMSRSQTSSRTGMSPSRSQNSSVSNEL